MNVIHTRAFDSGTPLSLVRGMVDWQQRSVTVYGRVHPQPRLTRWYGPRPYPYSGLTWEAAPLPGVLQDLLEKVSRAAGHPFDSVLCNLYRDGSDCVGWHADDEPLFGPDPVVASLSYGAARTFKLRPREGGPAQSFVLEHGDLFVMGKGVQTGFLHSVPRTARKVNERVNLTFRKTMQS